MTSVFQQRASQNDLEKKQPNGSAFRQRSESLGIPEEPWYKDLARTILQIPQGIAKRATYPLDLAQIAGVGAALDPEEIEHIKMISERHGIPFDEEKYMQSVQEASDLFPTQGNISKKIEETTGLPLEAKTKLQKGANLASTAATFTPGTLLQKGVAAGTAPVLSEGLQAAGVPESISEMGALLASGYAGSKSPKIDIGKSKKPSGLTTRQFEKLENPKQVSGKKIQKINEKVENEFRNIASDIIEKTPIEETHSALKNDIGFKQASREAFQEVEKIAEQIPTKISTADVKKQIADSLSEKKAVGFLPSEYEKSHNKFIKQFLKETPVKDASAIDLVKQYRKNNASYGEIKEPGQSFAFNKAKRDALLDYNKAIAEVIEKKFPKSEFSNLFKSSNEQWAKIMDAESIEGFIDEMFEGKINFKKGHDFINKNGMKEPFKRALGKDGLKEFEQLMGDLMSTEKAHSMMQVAQSKGYKGVVNTGLHYVIHPALGKAKLGMDIAKSAYRQTLEMILDKPQLTFTWERGVKAFKKGDFAKAEKEFNILDKESKEFQASESKRKESLKKFNEKVKEKKSEVKDEAKLLKQKKVKQEIKTEKKQHGMSVDEVIEFLDQGKSKFDIAKKESESIKFDNKIKEIKKQDISQRGLKTQKEFIINRIDDIIENQSKYSKNEKITIDVPGDGEFKIKNDLKALNQFKKDVNKKWPDKPLKMNHLKKNNYHPMPG